MQKNFRYNCLIGLGQVTETDLRASLAHAADIKTIGEEREFRKVRKCYSKI